MFRIVLFVIPLFLFFVAPFKSVAQQPVYQWAKSIGTGTAGYASGNAIKTDALGTTYISGFFSGVLDLDPTSNVFNLTSFQQSQDFFIAKYSVTGNLIWAKAIGNEFAENCKSMCLDNNGNILVTGTFSGTVDFDPSSNLSTLTSNGQDIFFAKYDSNGNFLWAKALNNNFNKTAYSITSDQNLNVIITGEYTGSMDFDPSLGTATYNVSGNICFLAKYDLNGNFLWVDLLNSSNSSRGKTVKSDNLGNLYLGGEFLGTTDFDFSVSTSTIVSVSNGDFFFAKYTSAGSFVWVKAIQGGINNSGAELNDLVLDANKNISITGSFGGTLDFDPNATISNITCNPISTSDIYIVKYDSLGNYFWAKKTGNGGVNSGNSIVADPLGNLFVTGGFSGLNTDFDPSPAVAIVNSNSGTKDIFILKYDLNGNYMWADGMGSGNVDEGYSIALENTGNVVSTGVFFETIDFDTSPSTYTLTANAFIAPSNFYISKYSQNTGFLSQAFCPKTYNASFDVGNCIKKDASGNIYVCGEFSGSTDFDPSPSSFFLNNQGGNDGFVAKYSPAGGLIWARSIGGLYHDGCTSLVVDNFGTVYVTGFFTGTCNFDFPTTTNTVTSNGFTDAFVLKYNNTGSLLWNKCFGTSSGNDGGRTITRDSLNYIYVAGDFLGTIDLDPSPSNTIFGSLGSQDIFVSKFHPNGNFIIGTAAGSSGLDTPNSIAVDKHSRIVLTGFFSGIIDFDPLPLTNISLSGFGAGDAFITKYDNNLYPMFTKEIGGNLGYDISKSIAIDTMNNYIITGNFQNTADFNPAFGPSNYLTSNSSSSDIFIAKYDSLGNYIWAKKIDGSGNDNGNGITTDQNSNIYITGFFSSTIDFLTIGISNLSSTSNDIVIAKYNPSGICLWAKSAGGNGFDQGSSILADNLGNVYTTGYFSKIADFDPTPQIANLFSSGNEDIFILKYNECAITNLSVSQNSITCFGLNNGNASVTAIGGSGYSYLWNPGGFTTPNISNLTAGSYSCVVTNSCGYTNTITATITQPSTLTLNTSPITNTVCLGSQANLSANLTGGIGPYTYTWSNGSNNSFNNFAPTVSSIITVFAADANNCSKSSTLNVTVVNNPTVTLNSSTTTICTGGSVTLSASGANSYFWSPTSAITPSTVVFPPGSLIYSVTGSDANNCTDTKSVVISVLPLPNMAVISSSSLICIGNNANLTASGAATYTWDGGSNNTSITVTPTVNTTYTVIGASGLGCVNTVFYTQNVSICTDLEKENLNKDIRIHIYPNPNDGEFYVSEFENNIGKEIEIYNSLGQLIKQLKIESLIQKVNIGEYPAGFYFVKIRDGNSVLSTTKIIKD
jgi:hypothetical protein